MILLLLDLPRAAKRSRLAACGRNGISALVTRAFDLGRRDRNPIAFLQDLIRRAGLAVDADKIVARFGRTYLLLEQLCYRRAIGNVHVVGESAAIVVDLC